MNQAEAKTGSTILSVKGERGDEPLCVRPSLRGLQTVQNTVKFTASVVRQCRGDPLGRPLNVIPAKAGIQVFWFVPCTVVVWTRLWKRNSVFYRAIIVRGNVVYLMVTFV